MDKTRFNYLYVFLAMLGVLLPRGIGALGYTIHRPTEDRYLMTKEELGNKMAVLLGGRAAEYLVFGHLSTGAADDLSRTTGIARAMVTRYAMVPVLGVRGGGVARQGGAESGDGSGQVVAGQAVFRLPHGGLRESPG